MKHLVATLLLAGITLTAKADNWPGFRGPGGQGKSAETTAPLTWSATENVVWKTEIPGDGWSSPAVFGARIFLTTATEGGQSFHLVCLDRKAGKIVWDREVVRQEAGHKQPGNSYATSTPVTDGERVYVITAEGCFACYSVDGQPLWLNRDIHFYGEHGLAVSPILYKNLVIAPFDNSSEGEDKLLGWQKPWDQSVIIALDKLTGKKVWYGKRGLSRIAHSVPAVVSVDGKDQLVSAAGDVVQGHDLQTGELIWTVKGFGESVVPSIVIGDGLIFAASGFGHPTIRAIRPGGHGDVTPTNVAWESTKAAPTVPSYLYVKPYLYTIAESGTVRCIQAASGQNVWTDQLSGSYNASPIYVAGRIYFLNDQGDTTVIQPGAELKVLARNHIGETTRASLAVSGGCMFLRTKQYLYCIGKP